MTRSRRAPHLCEPSGASSLRTFFQDSPMSTLMAAHLAKWWKSKFLNGYKQFTAVVPTDCSDGRASDTEELLGRHDYGVSSDKDDPEKTAPPVAERRQLSFEEFECDVSVEGGLDAGGQERQEFSFTLYDFDGHGKITKDDIAGLVTTIYDTLGSSIKVPHYGSKTIKVKLTVSPDQRKKPAETKSCPESGLGTSPTSAPAQAPAAAAHRVKFKRDLNVTIRESRLPRRTSRRRRCTAAAPPPPPPPPPPEDSSSCRSGASANNDDGAADISEDEDDDNVGSRQTTPKGAGRDRWGVQPSTVSTRDDQWWSGVRSGRTRARRFRTQHAAYRTPEQEAPRTKNRSSSLQREELLQIIQANMEKNNLSFQTSRKPCDRGLAEHRHHRHRHKLHYLHEPRTNCYLDLAGFDARMAPAPGRCDCQIIASGGRGHHRSRSHDLTHQLPEAFHHSTASTMAMQSPSPAIGTSGPTHARTRSRSHETELLRHERRYPPVVLGHTSSPHHLKHRNREQDQARAMAQVVRWLEQEFSSSLNTTDKLNTRNSASPQQNQPPVPPPQSQESPRREGATGSPGVSGVERHEHHHIHEHIHHHYHHYQDAPVLV